jgi:hypothetical protein
MFPNPIAEPAAAKINPTFDPHFSRLTFSDIQQFLIIANSNV